MFSKIYNKIFMKKKDDCCRIIEPDEKNYISYEKNGKIVRISVKKYKELCNLS